DRPAGAGRTTADEHRQRLGPRRCRRHLQRDRAPRGEDGHPRSSVSDTYRSERWSLVKALMALLLALRTMTNACRNLRNWSREKEIDLPFSRREDDTAMGACSAPRRARESEETVLR